MKKREVAMKKRVEPEQTLRNAHMGRQVRRAGTFILNVVLAGIVLAAALVTQLVLWRFLLELTIAAGAVALAILLSLRTALQWDRAVVLRLGRFPALKGPGIFFLVPILDRVARYVDMRIRATEFSSEPTLTKDTVAANADAICFRLLS